MSLPLSRRELLKTVGCGFGHLALAGLAAERAVAESKSLGQPTVPASAALRAASQAHHLPVHAGRRQPGRFVRLQARAVQGRRQDAGRRRRPRPGQDRDEGFVATRYEATLELRPARRVRALGFRSLPRDEPARRRPLLHPLDAHRGRGARPGDSLPALRDGDQHPALDGLLGTLRAGDREREPARLCLDRPSAGNGGARNYGNAFLPAVYQGTPLGKAGVRPRRPRSAT